MSSRLQLDMRNLSLGRRHLVNAYAVEAGIGVIACNTLWSMPERLECEVLQEARYINTLTFTYLFLDGLPDWAQGLPLLRAGFSLADCRRFQVSDPSREIHATAFMHHTALTDIIF